MASDRRADSSYPGGHLQTAGGWVGGWVGQQNCGLSFFSTSWCGRGVAINYLKTTESSSTFFNF